MLKFIPITLEDSEKANKVWHEIFTWAEFNKDPYGFTFPKEQREQALKDMNGYSYFVYDDDKLVGLSGSYQVNSEPESGWLSWFGVVPEERRNHYGAKIVALHEETLKKQGYKYSRLYTEAQNNEATCTFYERCGYVKESYYCPEEDPLIPENMMVVYSKTLCDEPVPAWNNKSLSIGAHNLMTAEEGTTEEEIKRQMQEMVSKSHE